MLTERLHDKALCNFLFRMEQEQPDQEMLAERLQKLFKSLVSDGRRSARR